MSFKMYGLGKMFLIEGSKKTFISSFFIFLIDKSLAVISSKKKFSLKKFISSELNFFKIQFLPLT